MTDANGLAQNVIAVASGKGGVGKSTVAVNLAVSLAAEGAEVGLLDADIHGPNIPIMMGIREQPRLGQDRKMVPLERHGVKLMSVGFMGGSSKPVIWRGPLVGRMIKQFLYNVDWGDLDYLFIDLPPGTGDAQLTLTQSVALTGGIIVSTPQDVALQDALKLVGVSAYNKPIASSTADRLEESLPARCQVSTLKNTRPPTDATLPTPRHR